MPADDRRQAALANLGVGGRLPISRSVFFDKFVWHSDADPYVPNTTIKRTRPVALTKRAVGFVESEIDAINEALIKLRDNPEALAKLRDATPFVAKPKQKSLPTRPPRTRRQRGARGNQVTG